MLSTIRPWQLFQRLGDNNRVEMVIPTIPGAESLTVYALETQLLITAARIVKAKTILEIGTNMGYTANHLHFNTDAEVMTIDIETKKHVFDDNGPIRFVNIVDHPECSYGIRDMVFIDGDHSYKTVRNDTIFALGLSPKVIAWHDYGNPKEPGVKQYLDELAETEDIIHVEESWLCFWFLCPPSK